MSWVQYAVTGSNFPIQDIHDQVPSGYHIRQVVGGTVTGGIVNALATDRTNNGNNSETKLDRTRQITIVQLVPDGWSPSVLGDGSVSHQLEDKRSDIKRRDDITDISLTLKDVNSAQQYESEREKEKNINSYREVTTNDIAKFILVTAFVVLVATVLIRMHHNRTAKEELINGIPAELNKTIEIPIPNEEDKHTVRVRYEEEGQERREENHKAIYEKLESVKYKPTRIILEEGVDKGRERSLILIEPNVIPIEKINAPNKEFLNYLNDIDQFIESNL
jgi:hypothetical protein